MRRLPRVSLSRALSWLANGHPDHHFRFTIWRLMLAYDTGTIRYGSRESRLRSIENRSNDGFR